MRDDTRNRLHAAIAEKPSAPLEEIAAQAGTTVADVVHALPGGAAVCVSGDRFVDVMTDIAGWGEITFIVNTGDVILEAKGELPSGKTGRGFFNLHGKPIAGHLKADACGMIAFVTRKLFGSDTCSVQMYAHAGHCLFKIYLGRDAEGRLRPDQIARFEALRDRLAAEAA
ncbi:heme utilization cystosolic carrier protein HutX [Myxococcota bacterium]|nr:heme utilization cystosolic carrier protein HutX [Myxococcota bacterium]